MDRRKFLRNLIGTAGAAVVGQGLPLPAAKPLMSYGFTILDFSEPADRTYWLYTGREGMKLFKEALAKERLNQLTKPWTGKHSSAPLQGLWEQLL